MWIVKPGNLMNKKNAFLLLLVIIVLGSFLRLYDISKESFWLDEGATALTIKKYDLPQILKNINEENKILPGYYAAGDLPIYYFLLEIWSMPFGISELSLRSFSAIFGILSLILVFYLANLIFNKNIALLSTFFAAINLTLIIYSQEARVYAFALFFSLLSIIFLIKYLKQGKGTYLTGFVISNLILLYSQFSWLIFVFAEGLYALLVLYLRYKSKKGFDKKLFAVLLIMGVISMMVIGNALSSNVADTESVYGRPDIMRIAEFGVQLSSYVPAKEDIIKSVDNFPKNIFSYEFLLVLSVSLISAIIAILFIVGIKNSKKDIASLLLAFMFFAPIAIILIFSLVLPGFSLLQIRQLIYVVPIYLIFASFGCFKVKFRNVAIILIIILSIFPTYHYYNETKKQEFREAAGMLPQEEIIFTNIHSAQVALKYYYGESDNIIGIKSINELKPHLQGIDSFWILFTFTKYSDPDGKIRDYIDSNYVLLEKMQFRDIELLRYGIKE